MRIHLAEAHRHGVDAQLQLLPEIGDLLFLLGDEAAEARGVPEQHSLVSAATQLQADREGTAEDRQREAAHKAQRQRMRQIQLPRPSFTPG